MVRPNDTSSSCLRVASVCALLYSSRCSAKGVDRKQRVRLVRFSNSCHVLVPHSDIGISSRHSHPHLSVQYQFDLGQILHRAVLCVFSDRLLCRTLIVCVFFAFLIFANVLMQRRNFIGLFLPHFLLDLFPKIVNPYLSGQTPQKCRAPFPGC